MAYAFFAQGLSLVLNIIIALIIPKILGVYGYGYWQLFAFYLTYVLFLQFGLSDGIYLRLGGKNYDDLDYPLMGTQFWIALFFQSCVAIIIYNIFAYMNLDSNRLDVLFYLAFYMVITNATNYLGYIFQSADHTKWFSISIIIDKVSCIVCMIILVGTKVTSFQWYILLQVISKGLAMTYCIFKGKKIVFSKLINIKRALIEILANIKTGINLMFSSIASMFILGSGRYIIDMAWGIEYFSKFSLALSLTNFILQFTAQIGVVLYPTLCKMDKGEVKKVYEKGREPLGILISSFFLIYVPFASFLHVWLPQYADSIRYMILMFPILIANSKMHIFGSLFMKVFRIEKKLLYINIVSCVSSIILCLIGAYIFRNIMLIILFLVVVIYLRSIITEFIVSKVMNSSIGFCLTGELLLAIIFVLVTWNFNLVRAFISYGICYVVYIIINQKKVLGLIKTIYDSKAKR
jgi:O-antigen/teichoic acid export membrane protein